MLNHVAIRRMLTALFLVCVGLTLHGQAQAPAATQQKPFEPTVGQAGQGRRLGADAAGARRQDARHGEGDAAGLSSSISARATAARSSPRPSAARARWASSTTPTWWSCRSATPPRQASRDKAHVHEGGPLRDRLLARRRSITMFLLPSINLKLRPKILDMKPGTRVVSNTFTMEDWAARRDADDHRATAPAGARRSSGSCRRRSRARGRCRKAI